MGVPARKQWTVIWKDIQICEKEELMAAFEKVCSGIPSMDSALDYIRLGDNVVWQVSSLDEFRLFARRFAEQAIRDGRNLIYVRFAGHPPILEPKEGLRILPVELSHRFETFTVSIHNLIEKEGKDALYVFDCLSELEEAWATDLLMGDFFHLTCPYLFSLDTIAYFPVIRGRHSFDAIAKIRGTTQLFLDVYPEDPAGKSGALYVRPLKVWNRSSETMFSPHLYDPENNIFRPLSEGVEISRFYNRMNQAVRENADQNTDSWERFFQHTRLKLENGLDVSAECGRICDIMLTRDPRLRQLIRQNFEPEDYFEIHSRMIGTGMIGGKACGMLLARKITENCGGSLFQRIEPHDSFYIGSDVFYSYIVDNGFWSLKIRQRTEAGYFTLAKEFSEEIMQGSFSPQIEAQFRSLIEYYGNEPIIVRSSSILEDGFGNAFAGKYDSVFCSSAGPAEKRLQEFEQAVRTVYASTASLSALDYRKRRGLENMDEQMAVLVQRVSGSRFGGFFMPSAAGVGYSSSPYRLGLLHPEAGMLRLVAGLGTAAVDRRTGSYPRMVSLDEPTKIMLTSDADRHRYSQRLIDVVGSGSEAVESKNAEEVRSYLPPYLSSLLYSHDWDAERSLREIGLREEVFYVSCEGIVKNRALMEDMKTLLHALQEAYQFPVDIEFTINLAPSGEYLIALLQCRPLQLTPEGEPVEIPQPKDGHSILLETKGVSMGFSRKTALDLIVSVDPIAYYEMPYREKYSVRDALSAINWKCREKNRRLLLLTPGRICTSSPELGVPSSFADISEFDAIVEISEQKAGYMPELSYGSHIFQDLVEAGILYSAVFESPSTLRFSPEILVRYENALPNYVDHAEDLKHVVRVWEPSPGSVMLYYDMATEHLLVSVTENSGSFARPLNCE